MDLFALAAHERKLVVIFTSHFVEPLAALREAEMALVQSDLANGHSNVAPVAGKRHVMRALGLAPTRRLLVAVEDVDAQEAVRQIINRWGFDYSGVVEVQVIPGGSTAVARFIELFPAGATLCRAIAVLDGDKKEEHPNNQAILFLPGTNDPIAEARASLAADTVALHLGVEVAILNPALAKVAHVDHHDFCAELRDALQLEGRSVAHVREALIKAWLNAADVAPQAEQISIALASVIDGIPLEL
jgi:hypothetical protein